MLDQRQAWSSKNVNSQARWTSGVSTERPRTLSEYLLHLNVETLTLRTQVSTVIQHEATPLLRVFFLCPDTHPVNFNPVASDFCNDHILTRTHALTTDCNPHNHQKRKQHVLSSDTDAHCGLSPWIELSSKALLCRYRCSLIDLLTAEDTTDLKVRGPRTTGLDHANVQEETINSINRHQAH